MAKYSSLYSIEQMQEMTAKTKRNYARNVGTDTPFLDFAVKTLYDYIKGDPIRYRYFGMYWWVLKSLFIKHDLNFGIVNFGEESDEQIKAVYCGENDEQSIVIADDFFRQSQKNYIKGNNQYTLNSDGDMYTLFDDEMERLIKS